MRLEAWLAVGVALGCLVSTQAHAADEVARACVMAHTDGQVERDAGRLLSARQHFLTCSEQRCPDVVRKECLELGEQVERETPSIVLSATDELTRDLPIALATIDATRAFQGDFGMAIELDPGLQLPDGTNLKEALQGVQHQRVNRVGPL